MYKYLLFLLAVTTVCHAVKIKEIKIPSTYILEDPDNPKPIVLDCVYELEPALDRGLVLKWLFNNNSVYQWIPESLPFTLGSMKYNVDTQYTASSDPKHKHRAMAIIKPTWNMTGLFTCDLQTFHSSDRKSSHLQVIVPDKDFQLSYKCCGDDTAGPSVVTITCSTTGIFPQPALAITLGDDTTLDVIETVKPTADGLFDAKVVAKVSKDEIISPTTIKCVLTIPKTNYTKKRETIYYDRVLTTTSPPDDEETSANSRLEAAHEPNGSSASTFSIAATIFSTTMLVIFSSLLQNMA